MKQIEAWDYYITDEMVFEILDSMTLEERKELDKRVNGATQYYHTMSFSERALAREFFLKGLLSSAIKVLTSEQKLAYEAELRAEKRS